MWCTAACDYFTLSAHTHTHKEREVRDDVSFCCCCIIMMRHRAMAPKMPCSLIGSWRRLLKCCPQCVQTQASVKARCVPPAFIKWMGFTHVVMMLLIHSATRIILSITASIDVIVNCSWMCRCVVLLSFHKGKLCKQRVVYLIIPKSNAFVWRQSMFHLFHWCCELLIIA